VIVRQPERDAAGRGIHGRAVPTNDTGGEQRLVRRLIRGGASRQGKRLRERTLKLSETQKHETGRRLGWPEE
jgi:hypothetical protein